MTPAAATRHSVTCPQAVRTANHQRQTGDWWRDPRYRALSDQFLRDNPVCEYCGKPSSVVHHDNAKSYRSQEEYYNPANFTPTCHRCHHEYRAGKILCPVCRQHYIRRDGPHDRCLWCRGIKQPGKPWKRKYRQKHPCGRRVGQQQCRRDGRTFICGHSAAKCRACDYFREREAAHG